METLVVVDRMTKREFGEYLRGLRKAAGLTQDKLARKLEVHSSQISRWETGENLPDPARLRELAQAMDADLEELLVKYSLAAADETTVAHRERDQAVRERNQILDRLDRVVPILERLVGLEDGDDAV
ncbi:MAG: helix-turn-helix domain-containing protein [Chloroflexi bacterium]|nr:helix-turn-helix domain-containing protein [Chloroflexota bacterium]